MRMAPKFQQEFVLFATKRLTKVNKIWKFFFFSKFYFLSLVKVNTLRINMQKMSVTTPVVSVLKKKTANDEANLLINFNGKLS